MRNIYYKFIIPAFVLLYPFSGISQPQTHTAENWPLNSPPEAGSHIYVARDYIHLQPGFSFSASTGNTFHAKIDQTLVFPPTENTYAKPDGSITPNPALGGVVGAIPGNFDVSPSGAATYTIPIECPVGINGMQPNISLVYNSQGGNGIAGWGWNIGGMSAISRTGSTFYHDGKIGAIELNNSDSLMLDGQRLIRISGSHFTTNAKYRTEIETYCDISYKSINGFMCFEVITKDGVKMEYGSSADSFIEAQGVSTPLVWLLKKVTDTNNNYMIYEYGEDNANGEYWLTKISYTGNTLVNISPVNTIEFAYTPNRFDSNIAYIAGKKTAQTKILSAITTKTNSQMQREYSFSYYDDKLYKKLSEINLKNSDGEKYNPTKIEWDNLSGLNSGNDDVNTHTFDITLPLSDSNFHDLFFTDLNNDGYVDVIRPVGHMPLDGSGCIHYFGWDVYLSTNKGQDYILSQSDTIAGGYTIYVPQFIPVDINKDGFMDLAEIQFYGNGGYGIDILLNENGRLVRQNLTCMRFNQTTHYFDFLDFDGDGEIELLIRHHTSSSNNYLQLYRIDIVNDIRTDLSGNDIGYTSDVRRVRITDVNGNGKPEIYCIGSSEFWEYLDQTHGFVKIPFDTNNLCRQCIAFPGSGEKKIEFVDINGDGKTDLITHYEIPDNDNEWKFMLSTGNSFVEIPSPLDTCKYINGNLSCGTYFFSDYNGDGKKDIIKIASDSIHIYYFNGSNFVKTSYNVTANSPFYFNRHAPYYDTNGDGKCDLIGFDGYGFTTWSFNTNEKAQQISSITNGIGQKYEIFYRPTTNDSVYDKGGKTYQLPVIKTPYPLIVTSKVNMIAGNFTNQTEYFYKGMKVHTEGKGLLGFDEMQINNLTRNIREINKYDFDPNYFNVFKTKQVVIAGQSDTLSVTDFSNSIVLLGGKRIFPYVSKQTITDKLKGVSSQTQLLSLDGYGNPLSIKTTNGNSIENKTMRYTQRGSWCPNKPDSIVVSKLLGSETHTRIKKYLYDANGNPTKETIDPGDINQVVIDYLNYDSCGHAKKIITTANGISRSQTFTYTPSKRFLKTKKNDLLNETITYNYDEVKGLLTSKVDRSGTTIYLYDGFGRPKQTSHPNGIKTVNALRWAGTLPGKPNYAKYYSYSETSGQSPVWVWYDGQGRKIRQDSYGLNKKKIMVETKYNAKGQVLRVSNPYFENTAITWADSCIYDAYGRISKRFTPMGATHYTYSGLTDSISSPTGTKKTTINSAGWIVEEKINGKKVTFTHYANGQVKIATPEGGGGIGAGYDLQGNRTSLSDPDAGVITSKYDGWGQLMWEKQAIHNSSKITTDYKYHPSGLLQYKICNNDTTQHLYDGSNRVNVIFITGRHKQTFTYDNFDRITNIKEEIDSKVFNRQTSYDVFGRIQRETYPSDYYTENIYDSYSNLTEVKDNAGRSIQKITQENAFRQPTEEWKGSKKTSHYYTSLGQPERIWSDGIIDLSFAYNSKANLVHNDEYYPSSRFEELSYDNMNRLEQWHPYDSPTGYQISYHPQKGNITSKTDVGSNFRYGEHKDNEYSHALTSFTATNGSVAPSTALSITYTDFKKLKTLTEGNKQYSLTYGVDEQRRKSMYSENSITKQTRYYFGDYEEEISQSGNIRKIHYLPGAVFIQNNGKDSLLYLYTDRLGSLRAITDATGTVLERYAYDPWGMRRNPNNWSQKDTRTSFLLNRGFTMHEHLDAFGVINMNGRVYDPLTGIFFSPDPYVQAPENWLNYNRYAYCMNSPMMYIDPDGEFFWFLIIGAVVGAYTGGVIANKGQFNPIKWNWSSSKTWGYMLGGAVVGAGSAWLGGCVVAGGGAMSNTMAIGVGSFTNSMGMHIVTNGKTPVSVSFGVGSYTFRTNEVRSIFDWKDLSVLEKIGYSMGALGNVADVVSIADKFFNGENKIANKANTVADSWEEQGHTMDNLDPNTVGNNLDGTSYMGDNNPMLQNEGGHYYGKVPGWGHKEYAAYLHDVDYVNMGIDRGGFSYLLGNKTLPADWSLAGRQLYLSLSNSNFSGVMWGLGMTTIAAYKTPLYLFRFLGIRW